MDDLSNYLNKLIQLNLEVQSPEATAIIIIMAIIKHPIRNGKLVKNLFIKSPNIEMLHNYNEFKKLSTSSG